MRKGILTLAVTVVFVAGCGTSPPASAQTTCDIRGRMPVVTLVVFDQGMRIREPRGALKLRVKRDGSCARFNLRLREKNTTIRNGQITLRVANQGKTLNGQPLSCTAGLRFADQYTNTGTQTMEITVVSDNTINPNDFLCFDILVKDIGVLDPRARVVDEDRYTYELQAELRALISFYDEHGFSSTNKSKLDPSLDEYLRQFYDLTEQEARELIAAD